MDRKLVVGECLHCFVVSRGVEVLIQLVCILKSFVAYRAVVLLAGAGEGTLFSLFESGGGGLFDGFAAVLDGCGSWPWQ